MGPYSNCKFQLEFYCFTTLISNFAVPVFEVRYMQIVEATLQLEVMSATGKFAASLGRYDLAHLSRTQLQNDPLTRSWP